MWDGSDLANHVASLASITLGVRLNEYDGPIQLYEHSYDLAIMRLYTRYMKYDEIALPVYLV